MKFMLGYTDKKGACYTMFIKPEDIENKLKWLTKKRYNAVVWEDGNRSNEVGWVYKHDEAGWVWCLDSDIIIKPKN